MMSEQQHYFTLPVRRYSSRVICDAVARAYSLPTSALRQHTRRRDISHARQLAMWLLRRMSAESLQQIGRHFAMHHTTVLHAIKHVDRMRVQQPELDALIERLRAEIERDQECCETAVKRSRQLSFVIPQYQKRQQQGVA